MWCCQSLTSTAPRHFESVGFRLDADVPGDDGFRVVQLTPPGSPASIIFGNGVTASTPGSTQGIYLVVDDIGRENLAARGWDGTSAPWTGSEPDKLRVVCVLQRPRRQRLGAARNHRAPAWPLADRPVRQQKRHRSLDVAERPGLRGGRHLGRQRHSDVVHRSDRRLVGRRCDVGSLTCENRLRSHR